MSSKHKIYLTHASTFDFKTMLYQPLKSSSIADKHQIIFPHETNSAVKSSKEIIRNIDLVLAEISHPSTGQGIELGWADSFKKPIICFYQHGKMYSSSIPLITHEIFEYDSSNDLLKKLSTYIEKRLCQKNY